MFSLLHICSYLAAVVAFLFVTLSLASGLLYIAELVEEHSRIAKLVGQRSIYNFSKTWPYISLSSLKFIASCLLVILDHFAWFFYFADRAKETSSGGTGRHPRQPGYRPGSGSWESRLGSGKYAGLNELSFMDVATFFGVCVWLVPFFLFLSLSANDNVLPSLGEQTPQIKTTSASDTGSPRPALANLRIQTAPRSSILKVALDPVLGLIPQIGGRNRSSRSQRDGLIASPLNSAPPSPSIYGEPTSPFGASPYTSPTMPNGFSNYDPSSLSPQTPFANRFAEQALRPRPSSPQLRMPPGPKRSVTTPIGERLPGVGNMASVFGSPNDNSPPKAGALGAQEEAGVATQRSVSTFATGAGGGQGSGLVSRRKNY
ncbi:MAG: hypothetical protein CYPHOPRED_000106 [Cyphobasidiales sp. Tagirdzhanova-0007]|nr:MAG: hypothetical protein CYPHOPRED_000106 [Cyphobasidiales sp. Tagirdzhanova-0007]